MNGTDTVSDPPSALPDSESAGEFYRELIRGLRRRPKKIPCKFLYDARGSRLFEEICRSPDYYPARTEAAILQQSASEIAELAGPDCLLVEPGSGSSTKTRILLDALPHPAGYVPLEISRTQLDEAVAELTARYPTLPLLPVCGDYCEALDIPAPPRRARRQLIFFPGSTIGNFEPEEAVAFLRRLAGVSRPGDGLLIGVDLKKDPDRLNAAYNDSEGLTAAFNLNLLVRANRELGATFDLDSFRHHAFYHPTCGRVEMHLISQSRQTVGINGSKISFAEHENVTTEYSYKYGLDEFRSLAEQAGFSLAELWTDPERLFSVQFFLLSDGSS